MTTLEYESVREAETAQDALDAAGADYDTRMVVVIEVEESDDSDEAGRVREHYSLETPSLKATARAIARHPAEWVTANEIDPEGVDAPSALVKLHYLDVTKRRERSEDGRGRNPYEYKLRESYRRDADVMAGETA